MKVYKVVWEDRNKRSSQWVGTKKELSACKAAVRKQATKRPYDQVEIVFASAVDIPTNKASMLRWLNRYDLEEVNHERQMG